MADHRTYQIHCNVNVDHGDAALRVTMTWYDEQGFQTDSRTWRKHVKPMVLEGTEWTAYSGVVDLARMMAAVCGTSMTLDDIDEPLF